MIKKFEQSLPAVAKTAYVDETALVIGEVSVAEDASLWPMVVVRGDIHSITIGARTNVQDHSVIHVTRRSEQHPCGFPVVIGNDVTIGHRVILHGCTIENTSLIGMGSVLLDDAYVESNVLLGAGSLVPPGKRLKGRYLWMGSPVKKIRPLTDHELEALATSAKDYVDLKNRY